mgnify:CR=1 FL=1
MWKERQKKSEGEGKKGRRVKRKGGRNDRKEDDEKVKKRREVGRIGKDCGNSYL